MSIAFIHEGVTVPTLGEHPWFTRCNPEANRDGWNNFGQGPGLLRLVWDNSDFAGIPRIDGFGSPSHWQNDQSGCGVPGSLRYVGEWYCPPGLGKKFFFALSTARSRHQERVMGIERLFLNGELVGGHQTRAWAEANGLGEVSPRDWPIIARQINWLEVTPDIEQAWAEVLTEKFEFGDGERVEMMIEYAVEDGDNFFAMKICNMDLGDEYHFAEIFAPDLCYPDHTLIYPQIVDAGDDVLISWWTTRHPSVILDGVDVGSNGSMVVRAKQSTLYRFQIGHEEIEHRLVVR